MSEKKHNGITGAEEFLRYRKNNLTRKDRKAFERELQKDPFASEAEEGLSSLGSEEIEEDLGILQSRLKLRTHKRKTFIYYRAAASVAIIAGLTVMFIFISRNRQEDISDTVPVALSVPESAPITRKQAETDAPAIPAPARADKRTEQKPAVTAAEKEDDLIIEPAAEAKEVKHDEVAQVIVAEEAKAEQPAENVNIARAIAATDTRKAAVSDAVAGGVPAKAIAEKNDTEFVPAEPVNGYKEFEKYVSENQRKPTGFKEGNIYSVELSFIIRPDGTPDKIKIVSSPGKAFSDEAVRLLKEGPKWLPASKGGKTFTDSVHLIIKIF